MILSFEIGNLRYFNSGIKARRVQGKSVPSQVYRDDFKAISDSNHELSSCALVDSHIVFKP